MSKIKIDREELQTLADELGDHRVSLLRGTVQGGAVSEGFRDKYVALEAVVYIHLLQHLQATEDYLNEFVHEAGKQQPED